jgi:hypothetical protein
MRCALGLALSLVAAGAEAGWSARCISPADRHYQASIRVNDDGAATVAVKELDIRRGDFRERPDLSASSARPASIPGNMEDEQYLLGRADGRDRRRSVPDARIYVPMIARSLPTGSKFYGSLNLGSAEPVVLLCTLDQGAGADPLIRN